MNNKNLLRRLFALTVFFAIFAIPTESQAVAMYARQTGQACASCHFQHYPLLNEFGRAFKAGGYTLLGTQGEIKGENLSIPETLNIGIVAKIRYQKTNGPNVTSVSGEHGINDGRWDIPDELNVLIGGRISKNIGFFLEGVTAEAPFLGGFKIPFIYDVGPVKVGVVPFSTGELGVPFGFELLNTGAVKNQRMAEQGADISAQQYVIGPHAARGAAFVVSNPLFFVNVSKWSPGHLGEYQSSPEANYIRAAVTPKVGSWDLGAGVQSYSGSAEIITDPDVSTTAVSVNDTKAFAVDAQAQGMIGIMPLGIYLSYAKANATSTTGTINYFNKTPGNNETNAAAIAVELGVLPRKATVILAYRKADNGKLTYNEDNAVTVGGTYQIVQNMQLQLTHAMRSGSAYDAGSSAMTTGNGDSHTTLLLFGSF